MLAPLSIKLCSIHVLPKLESNGFAIDIMWEEDYIVLHELQK